LIASSAGQPESAGTRKVKPIWILMKQETIGWQWHQLDHMQITCTAIQISMPASHHSIFFSPVSGVKALKANVTHIPAMMWGKFCEMFIILMSLS